ncbi:hypothetical protein [Thermosulfurimonas dismutans]|uniref:Uncharacterized protein n=1 Tax=Thermosulfurimonas dismutans TaxID=999894 RepID=A0A179D6H6_9BACT|nr:hypothetical protein [Thermosulfurimonas dismutans]OAQ21636.1 hypothetical protein TDIS_0154 [Thermosulfurimonas dismutans]
MQAMARIRKEEALRWLSERLPGLREGECLDFLCKKRNRLVRIIRKGEGFLVEERGFFREDFEVPEKELFKLAERLFAREFPRSFMLWAHKRRA